MRGLEPDQIKGLIDGQERSVRARVASQLDLREYLSQDLCRGSVHDRVCGRDDDVVRSGRRSLERILAGCGDIPNIDVAKEIPAP